MSSDGDLCTKRMAESRVMHVAWLHTHIMELHAFGNQDGDLRACTSWTMNPPDKSSSRQQAK